VFAVVCLDRDVLTYHRHIAEVEARPPDPIQVPKGKPISDAELNLGQ